MATKSTIRITSDTMKELENRAMPFETPSDRIRRVLKKDSTDQETSDFDMGVCRNVEEASENA